MSIPFPISFPMSTSGVFFSFSLLNMQSIALIYRGLIKYLTFFLKTALLIPQH